LLLVRGRLEYPARWPWRKLIAAEITFLALLTALHAVAFRADPWAFADSGDGGGLVGWTLSALLIDLIGRLPPHSWRWR